MELEADDTGLVRHMAYKAQELARALGCGESGARFVINCKADDGQTVDHLHVLDGRAMQWPPG
jgi:histidine triad (HIT) family protein